MGHQGSQLGNLPVGNEPALKGQEHGCGAIPLCGHAL